MALAATLSLATATAQKTEKEKDKDKDKKKQSITIIRTGDSDEKITVEVTGDKITINGKPAEEYKGADVQVITSSDNRFLRPGRVWAGAPGAPMAIAGPRAFSAVGANKAVLGVSMDDAEGGAKVTEVTKESAAEKAGLKVGDVITKVNDYNVADADDLPAALSKFKPEEKVTITYKRDGKEATTSATLQQNKNVLGQTFVMGDHDFNFDFKDGQRAYTFSRKTRLGIQIQDLEEGDGVKVLDVSAETPAGKAGLQKDDVITSFNGKDVKNIEEMRNAFKEVKEGDTVKLTYKRAGAVQTAEIKFPKPVKKASL